MDPVSESFNAWYASGGRAHAHQAAHFDFGELYLDDPLEDEAPVDGGTLVYEGGSFKHAVLVQNEIRELERAVDADETEEEHYAKLIVPLEDEEEDDGGLAGPHTKKPVKPVKRGGGTNFRQNVLSMLDTLPLK
jgi:hypothetical protein